MELISWSKITALFELGSKWAAFFALVLLVAAGISAALNMLIRRASAQSEKRTSLAYLGAIAKCTSWFLGVGLGLLMARFLVSLPEHHALRVTQLAFILLTIQAAKWSLALTTLAVNRSIHKGDGGNQRKSLQALAEFVLQVTVWAVAILIILGNLGINVTALVTGLGIGAAAIALAIQNILKDLFASVSLVLDQPFEVGDFIIIGSDMGTVEKIGIKTTRIRAQSGEELIVSNSDLLAARIRNFRKIFERRAALTINVSYETAAEILSEIPKICETIIRAQSHTRFDRAHLIRHGELGLVFEIVFFVTLPEFARYLDVVQAVNIGIHGKFTEKGIGFAYQSNVGSAPSKRVGNVSHSPKA